MKGLRGQVQSQMFKKVKSKKQKEYVSSLEGQLWPPPAKVFSNSSCLKEVILMVMGDRLFLKPVREFDVYYAKCQFSLKFEVLSYVAQQQQQLVQNQSLAFGFRLKKEGSSPIVLNFGRNSSLLQIWVKYLRENLIQWVRGDDFLMKYNPVLQLKKNEINSVQLIKRRVDKKYLIAKVFSKGMILKSAFVERNQKAMQNEIAMLRRFKSACVVKLEAILEDEFNVYIITEFANGLSLKHKNQKEFKAKMIKNIMKKMLEALFELKQKNVVHRDIKLENIVLRGNGLPVLIDFGLAADIDSDDCMFQRCGTPGYVAPEIINYSKGEKLTFDCDIFSLGAVFHFLLLKFPLFKGATSSEVEKKNLACQFSLAGTEYQNIDAVALNLLRRMLQVNPKQRIKVEQALKHEYFTLQGSKIV